MSDEKKYRIDYVQGVEGNSIYLNDYRIGGPKPWGGGKILKSWTVTKDDLERAVPELFENLKTEAKA